MLNKCDPTFSFSNKTFCLSFCHSISFSSASTAALESAISRSFSSSSMINSSISSLSMDGAIEFLEMALAIFSRISEVFSTMKDFEDAISVGTTTEIGDIVSGLTLTLSALDFAGSAAMSSSMKLGYESDNSGNLVPYSKIDENSRFKDASGLQ